MTPWSLRNGHPGPSAHASSASAAGALRTLRRSYKMHLLYLDSRNWRYLKRPLTDRRTGGYFYSLSLLKLQTENCAPKPLRPEPQTRRAPQTPIAGTPGEPAQNTTSTSIFSQSPRSLPSTLVSALPSSIATLPQDLTEQMRSLLPYDDLRTRVR